MENGELTGLNLSPFASPNKSLNSSFSSTNKLKGTNDHVLTNEVRRNHNEAEEENLCLSDSFSSRLSDSSSFCQFNIVDENNVEVKTSDIISTSEPDDVPLCCTLAKKGDGTSVFTFTPSEVRQAAKYSSEYMVETFDTDCNDLGKITQPIPKSQTIFTNNNKFVSKVNCEDLLRRNSSVSSKGLKKDSILKFQNISFDCPKSKKEYPLVSCSSLDSSLCILPSDPNNESVINWPHSSSKPYLDPNSFCNPLIPISLSPLTPVTPVSAFTSQASVDSGVLSALSSDLSQNINIEVATTRRRTASSVSSGISEVWQSSLDGDVPAPLEIVSESSKPNEFVLDFRESPSIEILSTASDDKKDGSDALEDSTEHNTIKDNKSRSGAIEDSVEHTKIEYNESQENFISTSVGKPLCSAQSTAHFQTENHLSAKQFHLVEKNMKKCEESQAVIFPVFMSEMSVMDPVIKGSVVVANKNKFVCNAEIGKSPCTSPPSSTSQVVRKDECSQHTLQKIEEFALNLVMLVLNEAFSQSISLGWSIKCSGQCNQELCREDYKKKKTCRKVKEKTNQWDGKSRFSSLGFSSCSSSLCWTPEIPFSPSHRSYSRNSKRSSLSFSHDSLISAGPCQDDSHLITGAVSHDALVFPTVKSPKSKKRNCTACLDNDIYSLPVDMVKPYQGPILQPKVIVQQPKKRYPSHCSKISHTLGESGKSTSATKRRGSNSKVKRINKGENLRVKSNVSTHVESSTNNKRYTNHNATENTNPDIAEATSCEVNPNADRSTIVESEGVVNKNKSRSRSESRNTEQSKLCKIIPFTSGKPHKRKDTSDPKADKKKSRSLSSNIRNTLVTLFSFKRSHKESGNSVNAKNEFIDASSQEFFDSSDGLKWGKICPLPSAPPLRNSVKCSAFTDHVATVSSSASKISSNGKTNNFSTDSKVTSNNSCNIANHSSHQRQSNSISPASLLSCLGHPRTNSIDEHERKSRQTSETPLKHPISGTTVNKQTVVTNRALPPLPSALMLPENNADDRVIEPCSFDDPEKIDEGCDFASIIEKVKNYGWYWGPISGEAAEKVLSNEPDGSFIVRDSSDYHYIFSLTFRLNGVTRHVRIEHDQGNFSFGGFTRFKSQTIVDFIEKAVEHSRSGRYLFFLHRRPVLGPMRVQLLHPVSRFKHVQSLQHLCRFIIVKQVRKDLIHDLPLPQRLKDYLSSPHYYSEQVEQCMTATSTVSEGEISSPKIRPARSPCLRHVSHRPSSARMPHTRMREQSYRSQISKCDLSLRASPNAVLDSDNMLFMNFRCSFPSNPSTSLLPPKYPTLDKSHRSRDLRLSSSQSSLETNLLQNGGPFTAYPVSPSTLSSSSASGKFNRHSFRLSARYHSLSRKNNFMSGSSHSSPSSPVPFDYSPPDWLSSSEDVFQVQKTNKKRHDLACSLFCHKPHAEGTQPYDNFHRLSFENGKLNTNSPHNCLASASSQVPQSNVFALDKNNSFCDTPVFSKPEITETGDNLLVNPENKSVTNNSMLQSHGNSSSDQDLGSV